MADGCLAVVPARAGSKGVPGKNLAPVGGRPLLAWTLSAARAARGLDRLLVTTDSEEIAAVAREWGAETPFIRPAELARDDSPGIDPLIHAVAWLDEHENYRPELVTLLQPTSPLRTSTDVEAALELQVEKDAEAVVAVTPSAHHPYWTKRVDESGRLRDFLDFDRAADRRQDLPPAYAVNGALYLVRREVLARERTLYPERTFALVMPPERSLDVDTAWDLRLADLLLRDRDGAV